MDLRNTGAKQALERFCRGAFGDEMADSGEYVPFQDEPLPDLSAIHQEVVDANQDVLAEPPEFRTSQLDVGLACLRVSARGDSSVTFRTEEGRIVMYVNDGRYNPE